MNDVAAVDMELEVSKIIRTGDDAILSLRLKTGRKRLSNAATIGKDEPGRRPRTIGIPWLGGAPRYPSDVIQQVAGVLARLAIRFTSDELYPKPEEFTHDAAIFVKQADVHL